MSDELILSDEEFENIEFTEKRLFEINYEDHGFNLLTEIGSNKWYIEPLDPEEEAFVVFDVDTNSFPLQYNGVEISIELFEVFQSLEQKEREA